MKAIRHYSVRLTGVLVIVLLLVLASCTSSTTVTNTATTTMTKTAPPTTVMVTPSPTATPTTPPAAMPGSAPPEATQYAKDWPQPGRDYSNSRATMDTKIDSSNVGTLGVAWAHNVPSGQSTFGSISTTPIIMGNNVYIQDIGNNVFVLDLATGQQKWQTVYNLSNLGPNGASVGYGKVFASAGPYDVVALDANTGKEIWRTTLVDISKNPSQGVNGIDMQTSVYDGLVYISTVPGNAGIFYAGGGMGVIYALDQATGKIVWSFNTIKDPNLWGHPDINSGGGCWYPPAIDTATGNIFFGIANPAPFPGQAKSGSISQEYPNGSSRPGDNLYTDSLMSFNHKTGAVNWYNQVWPHDTSDYDLMIPPILATAKYNGVQQDIVLAAGKMGRVYAMNRQTGALLWTTSVGEHNGNDELAGYSLNGTTSVIPGIFGGVETPMAYADGVVYVQANNLGVDYTNGVGLRVHSFAENTADMVAIDVNTGHILWDVPLKGGGYGGATVVNDLVFTGTSTGMLYAFKRDTGAMVWSYQAPASVNAWPAVAGDTIVWPIAGAGTTSVLGFKLGATSPAIKFVTPAGGAQLAAGDLQVTVEATNFNLADKLGKSNIPGEGHIHYFLDVDAPTAAGQPAIPAGSTWAASASPTYTFKNVAPGTHTISAELVNNDHTPLNPPVVQKITVTLDNNPRISIIQPQNGAVRKAGSVTITVDVSQFNLVDKLGQASVPGEGHIHYYMDVVPPNTPGAKAIPPSGSVWAASTNTTYTFDNVPVGIHHFYVQLVNNDHTPLSPNVTAEIQIYTITYTGGLGGQ